MKLLDGQALANQIKNHIQSSIASRVTHGMPPPSLKVFLVGEKEASEVYVRQKTKACKVAGIRSHVERLAENTSPDTLKKAISDANHDPHIHAILVQLPLPKHLAWQKVVPWIEPSKDVDGLTPHSQGLLFTGSPGILPCTPAGIMKLLDHYNIPIKNKNAVVVGRSHIVGLPTAVLLLKAHATLTVCHSMTLNLREKTRAGDIVVVAAGRPGLLGKDDFTPGTTIIDVGIHRTSHNGSVKIVGDVLKEELHDMEGFITPVPKGVGPMTVAMLLANTFKLAYKKDPYEK